MHRALLNLLSGNGIAQLISIFGVVILSIIYGPEKFGYYSAFLSLVGIFSIISCLTYEQAIPLPKKLINSYIIFLGCTIINSIMSFLILPLLFHINEYLHFFPANGIKNTFSSAILFICVFLVGILMAVNFWSLTNKRYEFVRNIKIAQPFLQVVLQVLLCSYFENGLIAGYVIALFCVGILAFFTVTKPVMEISITQFINRLTYNLKKYKRFPLISTWEVLLNGLSVHFLPLYFVFYFTADFAGQYALATRLVGLPMILFGSIFSQYIFSKTEIVIKSESNQRELSHIVEMLLFISFSSFCFIHLSAETIFSIILGAEWKVAGEIASIMALAVAGQIVGSPLSSVFPILQKQTVGLSLQVILFLARFLPLILLVRMEEEIYLIYTLSICTFISYVIFTMVALSYTHISLISVFLKFVKQFKLQVGVFVALVTGKIYLAETSSNFVLPTSIILTYFAFFIVVSVKDFKRLFITKGYGGSI